MTRRFVSAKRLIRYSLSNEFAGIRKVSDSLLAETLKRRVIPATKFKFFTSTWQFLFAYKLQHAKKCGQNTALGVWSIYSI